MQRDTLWTALAHAQTKAAASQALELQQPGMCVQAKNVHAYATQFHFAVMFTSDICL